MAIDDNTSYELTGAQVKDLAQRIKAGGGGGVLIGYINYTAGTVPSGNISVYTDTTYTTAISADDVAAALDNGDTVFFKFTDGWDEIKILSIADSEAMIGDDTIVYHFMASSSKDCIGQLQGHVNDWNVAYFLSTLKTVGNGTLTITQNGTSAGTFSANASGNSTIALTDTTYSAMTGATSGAAGTSGLVPAPAAGDQDKVLKGDGTWGAAADVATVIYMVKTADSGTHDYTVVFYTELAHTNTVSYSTVNEYVTDGKSVLIIDGIKSSGSPLAAVTGAPKGTGPMNAVVDGALYKFSYSSGTTYLDIDGILSADPIQSTSALTPPVQTNMIADGAVTNAKLDWSNIVETVSVSDYITPASGYTLSDTFGYRIGKIVILCFAFQGTIVSGENVIGSCSNNFACDFFGAGRVARWQGGTDNTAITVMCIPGGNCRIYSPAANTQGMATVILVET